MLDPPVVKFGFGFAFKGPVMAGAVEVDEARCRNFDRPGLVLWPGLNQLFTELSRSYFLSNGQWPIHSLIRVPIGAYGSGGPSHSSSIESVLANIRGIKVVYPSTGADLKGLLKNE